VVPSDPQPAQPAQEPQQPPVLEHSPLASSAPFVVTLKGPTTPPQSGEVELTMVIDAAKPMKVPTNISVTLPSSAKLTSGQMKETLAELPGGKTTRTFKVSLSGKLTDPIRVIVDSKDPGGAFGARAERLYPETPEVQYNKPFSKSVPPPPVGRPGSK
jgi:hypothetical protein